MVGSILLENINILYGMVVSFCLPVSGGNAHVYDIPQTKRKQILRKSLFEILTQMALNFRKRCGVRTEAGFGALG